MHDSHEVTRAVGVGLSICFAMKTFKYLLFVTTGVKLSFISMLYHNNFACTWNTYTFMQRKEIVKSAKCYQYHKLCVWYRIPLWQSVFVPQEHEVSQKESQDGIARVMYGKNDAIHPASSYELRKPVPPRNRRNSPVPLPEHDKFPLYAGSCSACPGAWPTRTTSVCSPSPLPFISTSEGL